MVLKAADHELEGGFTFRPLTMDDLEAAVELYQTYQTEYYGSATDTLESVRNEWETPGFDMENSIRGVFTPEDRLIAHVEVWELKDVPVRPFMWGYVHPEYRGRGIGTQIARWGEERARQVFDKVPEDARVVLEANALQTATVTKELFQEIGFTFANRSWWHMLIEMDSAPPQAQWPEGIRIINFADYQGDAMSVYKAVWLSFQDHRGAVDESPEAGYERWAHEKLKDEEFDPTLWYLAMDGDQIAGISLCRRVAWNDASEGYVWVLGVLRKYRQKGLGLALLQYSFGEFWKRGQPRVGLHVDGSSLTGATRLYEKAGMHVSKAIDTYEKELRPGRELSKQ